MRQAPALLEKKVAPRIIPKEERVPLAPQYRSYHSHSDTDGSSHGSTESNRLPAPTPTKEQIVFNEFRKPTPDPSSSRPVSTNNNNAFESALNNPDYFNPDTNSKPSTPSSSSSEDISDDDYFNANGGIETRSSLEEESDKLDNDPLNPPDKPKTSVTTTATTTSTTTEKPTTTTTTTEDPTTQAPAAKPEIEFRRLQPLAAPRKEPKSETDEPAGFIVNRAPENILEDTNIYDFNDVSNFRNSSNIPASGFNF